ncbi:nucleoside hydrolase [Rubellicoccus peritrichatus]|uniref:Nucleoside hydrolase n=1 Tax=Rubellicoccus peritrichatus TaxID=3080537 RepID=A0AAQ3L6E9_9BACT|nr:nucleoside hydrolase [Puniceicoccus sp. CR14]WOO40364.1 nucleoside hydrolase [Puniceicoccus sp. CR14]
MNFPALAEEQRIQRLMPPSGKVRAVLDTDTYNEVDDQFAVVHALLSPERIQVEGIYAAPFHNDRSSSPEDGMEKSYDEILRLLDRLHVKSDDLVHKGSKQYLPDGQTPVSSPATKDLIERARACPDDEPLYVVAIGAITNVASTLLLAPDIVEKIVIVWLGGHSLQWPNNYEFNLSQDIPAVQIVFNSGVPLIHIPCLGVASHLLTTVHETNHYLSGGSEIGDYLNNILVEYSANKYAWSKVIWDIATTAFLVNPDWTEHELISTPILSGTGPWELTTNRHSMRYVSYVNRDAIFGDIFKKIKSLS